MPNASLIAEMLVHLEVCTALALLCRALRNFLNDPAYVRTVFIRYRTGLDLRKLAELQAARELSEFVATNDRMAKT